MQSVAKAQSSDLASNQIIYSTQAQTTHDYHANNNYQKKKGKGCHESATANHSVTSHMANSQVQHRAKSSNIKQGAGTVGLSDMPPMNNKGSGGGTTDIESANKVATRNKRGSKIDSLQEEFDQILDKNTTHNINHMLNASIVSDN